MVAPPRVVIDARNVERFDSATQSYEKTALEREREGGEHVQLRQTMQLRKCHEKLRELFPSALIDIFICQHHYMNIQEDENLEAIRRSDPEVFHKVPGGRDVDQMLLARAIDMPGSVVISNDLFRDHIDCGFVAKRWVEQHVWGFMFVRGELVMPQLAKFVNQDEESTLGPRRLRHLRRDDAATSTALRKEPNSDAQPSPDRSVPSGEVIEVIREQSEMSKEAKVETWIEVKCKKGTGWMVKAHVLQLLRPGQNACHVRADNNEMPTALRPQPDIMAVPNNGFTAQASETVAVLEEREKTSNTGDIQCWVNVRTSSGEGWLKRVHLREEDNVDCPTKRRRRDADCDPVRHFHVKNLGYGESSGKLVEELKSVLDHHGVTVAHIEVRERQPPENKIPMPTKSVDADSSSTQDGLDDLPPKMLPPTRVPPTRVPTPVRAMMGSPPLARWYARDISLRAPAEVFDAMTSGRLKFKVDGIAMEFTSPLDPNFKRPGNKPYATWSQPILKRAYQQVPTESTRVSMLPCKEFSLSQVPAKFPRMSMVPSPDPPLSQVTRPAQSRSSMVANAIPGSQMAPRQSMVGNPIAASQTIPRQSMVGNPIAASQTVPRQSMVWPCSDEVPCSQAV